MKKGHTRRLKFRFIELFEGTMRSFQLETAMETVRPAFLVPFRLFLICLTLTRNTNSSSFSLLIQVTFQATMLRRGTYEGSNSEVRAGVPACFAPGIL